jgi:uncharacterized phage protein gp47/JayE
MTTKSYPLATLGATVDETGISIPTYSDVYASLVTSFQYIYGPDIYVSPDSQDGQWLGIISQAIMDCNNAAVAVFQAFSPTFAQGAGLSTVVKINGITRNTSGFSTAIGTVTGNAFTIVVNGVVQDENGNLWNLPSSVTIPGTASIAVLATAQNAGAIIAPSGIINKIYNPQYGWSSFISTSDAVVGAAVESDATLRARQTLSTSLSSQSTMDGILAAVGNVVGVTRFTGYDNDTGVADSNGVPANSIAVIVEGGAPQDIVNAIGLKKMPGARTSGTTSGALISAYGLPTTINYCELGYDYVSIALTITPLANFSSVTGVLIQQALFKFVNDLPIGYDVYYDQLLAVAGLITTAVGMTFKVSAMGIGSSSSSTGTPVLAVNDILIPYNMAASMSSISNVTLTI